MFLIGEKEVRGVIFDIDGTLVDSFSAFASAFNAGLKIFQLPPVPSEVVTRLLQKSLNLREILEEISPMAMKDGLLERCQREIWQHFLTVEATEVRPFPGVERIFRNLDQRGIKIGVATGRTSPPEREWGRFKRYGLDGFIKAIVTSRDLPRKPAPDTIIECARALDVPIEKCLVVGDTQADVIAGRRAGGISVVLGIRDGNMESQCEKPDFNFKTVDDFDAFLQAQRFVALT